MGVQLFIAVFLVKVPFGRKIVSVLSDAVSAVINCGQAGLDFVFGSLADSSVSGSIFIVQVLGNIIFDLCYLTLRFCEFFQSWHLCFRYSGSLPGEKKHACKACIPGDAGRGAGKPAERHACWFCNTFLRKDDIVYGL